MPVVSPEIAHRDEFPQLCIERGLLRIAVEVGCFRGTFARHFLKTWPGQTFATIDHWKPTVDFGYPRDIDRFAALHQLYEFGERVEIFEQADNDFLANHVRNHYGPVSFVFLDADHSDDGTTTGINRWWPKLADNGILAGHDYCAEFNGVRKAVNRFAKTNELTLHVTHDIAYPSWYVYRTETTPLQKWRSMEIPYED